jgi:3-hydroxyisobutyrate dehydrogenase
MMGYGMASNVRKKMPSSATLYIYDVVEAASRRFKDQFSSFGPIEIVQSSKEAAEKSGTLISMVPTGNDAREVYLNPTTGVIASSPNPDRLILESSTIDVATTQDIAKAITEAGIGTYLDTPVSGGVRGAEAGTLSFFLGYPDDSTQDPLKERIRQTINYMAKAERVSFCGKLGAGLVCKIVNNYIGLSNMVTAAEGMAIGMRYGVDGKTLYKCVKGSSGDSWVMDFAQPAPGVIDWSASSNGFEPLFTPRLCVKDISLGIKMAEDVGIHATMGEVAVKLFSKTDEDPRTKVSHISCGSVIFCNLLI